ncbi:hypothetical protein HCG46_26030 [Labrenzia sp. PO1]|uniref:hypothetical protein n=1 Tax=Labrenzia sp. PO1 TaxID=2720390 RepID=UPI0014471BBB|nr:hypothetical protein [Labrenzia sp. PO1]NKI61760.1 hypothetical protein [Labrenzia sp. PO1]
MGDKMAGISNSSETFVDACHETQTIVPPSSQSSFTNKTCGPEIDFRAVPSRASTDYRPLSNWEGHVYAELFQAIHSMSELPEQEDLFLVPEVAKKASSVLGFLKEQVQLAPPKIINQDGEALSFTWDDRVLKKYLTVSDEEIDLMHVCKPLLTRCEEVLSEGEVIDYKTIFDRFSGVARSSSMSEELED